MTAEPDEKLRTVARDLADEHGATLEEAQDKVAEAVESEVRGLMRIPSIFASINAAIAQHRSPSDDPG